MYQTDNDHSDGMKDSSLPEVSPCDPEKQDHGICPSWRSALEAGFLEYAQIVEAASGVPLEECDYIPTVQHIGPCVDHIICTYAHT